MTGLILPYQGKHPQIAADVFVAPNATVIGDVVVGAGSSVWFGAVIRGDYGPIRIGERVSIQDNAVVHVNHTEHQVSPTVIGDEVTIGHGAILEGCTVGAGSIIGMNAVVLPNANIGAGCIVGAGAVVAGGAQFEAGTLIVGSPAAAKKPVSAAMGKFAAEEYCALAVSYREALTGPVTEVSHYKENMNAA